jgi:hypothetical protein
MQCWSKGLGKKTIQLYMSKGESMTGGDFLYLRGTMEAPVSWEYIMPMRGEDIVDFLALLKDPAIARYIHSSPRRWELYGAMVTRGLALAGLVALEALRTIFGGAAVEEGEVIQVPPPSMLKNRKKKKKASDAKPARKAYKRKLGKSTTSAPSLTSAMKQQHEVDETESIDDAIQDAMEAASSISEN